MSDSGSRAPYFACLLLLAAFARPAAAVDHVVEVHNNFFQPRDVVIQAGDTVTWRNFGVSHNARADDGSFRCANGCDGEGGNGNPASNNWTFTRTFNSAGVIPYYCEIHGLPNGVGMAGTITVQAVAQNNGQIQLTRNAFQVNEGGGSAVITVSRTNGSDGAVSVHFATADGSAKAGQDYTATSGTLSWADGQSGQKSFSVPITDDTAVEGNETVTLSLSSPSGGATLGTPIQGTLTIVDNDSAPPPPPQGGAGEVQFASSIFEADEGSGNVVVTLDRVDGSAGAVSVQLAASAGTATPTADFQPVAETVSWANGDAAPKQVLVPLVDDNEDEGAETIHLALSGATGGISLPSPATATAVILDNDGAAGCSEAGGQTLCLGAGDRFKVQVSLLTQQGENGRGKAFPLTLEDSGLFTFFDPGNAEVLIKVLNTCSFSNHIWVFFAATTNQEYTLTVTDTQKGVSKYYIRDFTLAEPQTVFDFQAFSTCP